MSYDMHAPMTCMSHHDPYANRAHASKTHTKRANRRSVALQATMTLSCDTCHNDLQCKRYANEYERDP